MTAGTTENAQPDRTEALARAIEAVLRGSSLRAASRSFGIPRTSLARALGLFDRPRTPSGLPDPSGSVSHASGATSASPLVPPGALLEPPPDLAVGEIVAELRALGERIGVLERLAEAELPALAPDLSEVLDDPPPDSPPAAGIRTASAGARPGRLLLR